MKSEACSRSVLTIVILLPYTFQFFDFCAHFSFAADLQQTLTLTLKNLHSWYGRAGRVGASVGDTVGDEVMYVAFLEKLVLFS